MSGTELYLGSPPDKVGEEDPQYHVRLPIFEGPLELLLHLIRKNDIDIYDIPIADITRQYLDTLDLMESLNLNLAGEFLVMAATLIHIKSKMLLPPPHEDGTSDEPEEDPRSELVQRLLEYQRYKEAAHQLHEQEEVRSAMWSRPDSVINKLLMPEEEGEEPLIEVDLFELISAFREVLVRVSQRGDLVFEREVISVEEMMGLITSKLESVESTTFVELFDNALDRPTVIVTFLAILEMVRLRTLRIYQQAEFSTIFVSRNTDAL